jgi:hypothetical protein
MVLALKGSRFWPSLPPGLRRSRPRQPELLTRLERLDIIEKVSGRWQIHVDQSRQ